LNHQSVWKDLAGEEPWLEDIHLPEYLNILDQLAEVNSWDDLLSCNENFLRCLKKHYTSLDKKKFNNQQLNSKRAHYFEFQEIEEEGSDGEVDVVRVRVMKSKNSSQSSNLQSRWQMR